MGRKSKFGGGHVYVMKCGAGDDLKVGFSAVPTERARELRMTVLYAGPWRKYAWKIEAAVHSALKGARVRAEIFRVSPDQAIAAVDYAYATTPEIEWVKRDYRR
jgi:hypothetical protein